MSKLSCPHCGKLALSAFRKSYLGPVGYINCKACHKKIRAHWASMFVLLPFIITFSIMIGTDSSILYISIFTIISFIITTYINIKLIPIEKE